eukprot:3059138-Prorocentrum_lima.AAC.1
MKSEQSATTDNGPLPTAGRPITMLRTVPEQGDALASSLLAHSSRTRIEHPTRQLAPRGFARHPTSLAVDLSPPPDRNESDAVR